MSRIQDTFEIQLYTINLQKYIYDKNLNNPRFLTARNISIQTNKKNQKIEEKLKKTENYFPSNFLSLKMY